MTINYAPIYVLAAASPTVVGLLKAPQGKLRFFLFGEADQNTLKPYAVWQTVGGSPENYLGNRPDADAWTTQVDVYAEDPLGPSKARTLAFALIESLEGAAYVTSYNGEYKEAETRLFRFSFTCEFISLRT
jgi:uncharacterized protein DUF3168